MVTSIYHLVVRFAQPAGYNYWAVLGLDIFLVIMWLSDFAALGVDASAYRGYYSSYSYSSYYSSYNGYVSIWYALMAAGAGLGALELCVFSPPLNSGRIRLIPLQSILHTISLIIHSIRMHQHRKASLHCRSRPPATLPTAMVIAPGAMAIDPDGGEKLAYENFAQQPYAMQQPAPTYQQQLPQGQAPTLAQPTGGSFQQQPYQQGAPLPLFAQTTGGSTIQEQQQPSPTPQGVTPPPAWSELGNIQCPPTPQPIRSELGNTQRQ